MTTPGTVSRLAARLAEAGSLLAAVIVATFLNPFSEQVFEPDKIALLRAVVALSAAAGAIAVWERWANAPRGPLRRAITRPAGQVYRAVRETPMLLTFGLLLLSYLLSTATSVAPRTSWWGSYERAEGAYTFLAYLGLFAIVAALLRRRAQLERAITVLLVASIPVALYAIFQRFGTTLLQFSEQGIETRVISTQGNAIFLAAYLGMVAPLTAFRLFTAFEQREDASAPLLDGLMYFGLLILQLAAILFTQSRGPMLALLAEGFVLLLLLAVLLQRRWAVAGVAIIAALIVLTAIVSLGAVAQPSAGVPYLTRFAGMLQSTEVRARLLAWATTLEAVSASPGRVLVGYGPETMKPILTRYMPAELWVLQGGGRYGTFDRAHNAIFDALFARGVLGVLIYLLLYTAIFYQSLRWLGLILNRRDVTWFGGLIGSGALAGLIGAWAWRGDLVLTGVLVPAGMLAGLVVYLALQLLRRPIAPPSVSRRRLLIAALLAAIVGHFVETQTGIAVAATQTYLWLYLALLFVVGSGRLTAPTRAVVPRRPQPTAGTRSRRGRRERRRESDSSPWLADLGPMVGIGLVVAFMLGTLAYAFVHGFNMPDSRWPAQILMWLAWLGAGVVVLANRRRLGAGDNSLLDDGLKFAAASLAWLLPFVVIHRLNARALEQLDATYLTFVLWTLLTFGGVAVALYRRQAPVVSSLGWRHAAYAGVMLLVLAVVWQTDLRPVRADIYEKVAKTSMSAGLSDQALAYLERAVAAQPQQDQYYIFLGGAYVERARVTADPGQRRAWMERAEQVFTQAQALAPHNSDHPRQLGLMYATWAGWAADEATREQRLDRALAYYQHALELDPQNPDLHLGLGDVYLALGRAAAAEDAYRRAVDIGAPSHLARGYAGVGDALLMAGQLQPAAQAYRMALQSGQDGQEMLQDRVHAVTGAPESVVQRERLALAYAAADRLSEARDELNTALEIAAADGERAEVTQLMNVIGE